MRMHIYKCIYMCINYIWRQGFILCLATHMYTLCTYLSMCIHTYVRMWLYFEKPILWSQMLKSIFACTWKLHSCTIQRHQVLFDTRWPGLLLQVAFLQCCKTTRVLFMVLRDINKAGAKLIQMAGLTYPVSCSGLCHLLIA